MFYQIRSDWESSPEWCDCVCQDGTLKLWEFESGRKLQSCDLTEPEETPSTEADEQKVPAACEDSPVHWHVRPLRRLCVCVLFPRSPLCAGSAALLTLVMSLCSVRGENSAAIWWTNCRTDTHRGLFLSWFNEASHKIKKVSISANTRMHLILFEQLKKQVKEQSLKF